MHKYTPVLAADGLSPPALNSGTLVPETEQLLHQVRLESL